MDLDKTELKQKWVIQVNAGCLFCKDAFEIYECIIKKMRLILTVSSIHGAYSAHDTFGDS